MIFLRIIPLLSIMMSLSAKAGELGEKALKLVPDSMIVQERNKEVKLQTKNGSIVEIEFERDGSFEEASGNNVEKDNFRPESGLSLAEAVEALKKTHKVPVGEWSYEKSFLKGWHYEFKGFEEGREMEYLVEGATGKLLESRVDD